MNTHRFSAIPILAAFFTLVASIAFAETHDTTGDEQSSQESDTSTFTAHVPVLVMVPRTFKIDPEAKGCWVEMYSQENFGGEELTLVGPVDMAKMEGPFGFDWENEVESIKTGPKATITIYDNEKFAERSERVGPNTEITDLDNNMELFDDFRSMKIAC